MIKWLHISDLHIRNQADWNNSKKELYKKCAEIGKIDFVVVTGDFHDFSDKKDFSNAMAFLRELMNKLGLDILRDLFLIPGNHDGVSEIEYKDEMLVAAKARPLEIGKRVDELLKMFSDYEVFVRELIPSYPCEHPATVHIRSWNNQINLIHCNTALGADGETKIDQVLDIDGLSNLDVKGECPTVILAHNDFFDLNKQQQSRIKDFIFVNDIRAYLCGDKHKQSVKQITYRNNQNKQIPCIVSYKSAPDSSDKYSAFGIIVGTWENETATLEGWEWISGEGFKVDSTIGGQEIYMGSRPSEKRTAAPNAKSYLLLEEYSGWRQIATVNKAKNIILSMERFLQGHPCTWALAFSNILVERQQLDDLVQYIKSGGLYALLGAGAEGKSTLLKQVCVRLYYEGYTVLFHNKEENYVLPKDLPKDTVLVIDEPDDNGFQSLIEFAHDSEIPLIFAARRNEWNLFCKRNHILSETQRSITEIEVQNITDRKEAEAFADCVIKYCNLQAEREKLVEIFLRNGKDYGYLYAAMLLSIHNKEKLEDIATDIIDNIRDENNEAMKLLAYAVLHEHVGISLGEKEYKMFLSKLGLKPRIAKEALELELRQSGKHWETRHPQISDLFYNYFFGESGEYNMSETDSLRWEVLNSLLQKYCNSNYKEKEYIFEDVLNAIQLVNEGTEISDILERLIEEFRLDPKKLCKINSKLESDRHRETFGNLCYTHGIYYEKLLLGWATAANNMNGAGSYEEENSALWIYKKACIESKITDPSTWTGWAKLENKTNGAGSYEEENSALWIYKTACIERKMSAPGTWTGWAKLENEINGAGSYEEENSALWIYKKACIERKISAPGTWTGWAELENEINGAGSYEEENSALWIYKKACIESKITDPGTWIGWAELENEINGAGSYEEENSALWIYKKACIERKISAPGTWIGWAELENEINGAGSYEEENSALWIYKKACIESKITDPGTWTGWAKLENEINGAGSYEEENSALWIYKKACIESKITDLGTWTGWAKLENETNGAGSYEEENSALWIYKKACIESKITDLGTWIGWAELENEINGAGSYEEENSALWIYRKACIERKITAPGTWIGWAELENEINGAGSYEEENSALWIYRKACIERKITAPGTWIGWAELENEINGAGSYEEENSALWIYKTACIERKMSALSVWLGWVTHVKYNALCSRDWTVDKIYQRALEITNREEVFLYSYAKFLMDEGQFEESRSVIRELYLRDRKYLVSLLFVEMIAGNHDLNSGFCVEKLVHKAESHVSYSFGDQYALYVYYRFQKNEELAKKYYDMFDVSNDKNTHFIEPLEKFFITCQNAFGFK